MRGVTVEYPCERKGETNKLNPDFIKSSTFKIWLRLYTLNNPEIKEKHQQTDNVGRLEIKMKNLHLNNTKEEKTSLCKQVTVTHWELDIIKTQHTAKATVHLAHRETELLSFPALTL